MEYFLKLLVGLFADCHNHETLGLKWLNPDLLKQVNILEQILTFLANFQHNAHSAIVMFLYRHFCQLSLTL